jgi:sporulation protein YunB
MQRNRIIRHFKKNLYNYRMVPFVLFCLIIFLFVQGLLFAERRMRPAILSIAELKTSQIATEAVNNAILNKVARGVSYQDLINLKLDEEERIVMAQVNTMEINRLVSETTIATQNALMEISSEPLKIPLGEIFDNYFFAAYGPSIPIKLFPMGRVNTTLIDSFDDAGINQVRHKIYLAVITEVRIVIPFVSSYVEVQTTVPLADTIYPGEVPETIINFNLSNH